MKVIKIVLTGGPCGGKSSSLNKIKEALQSKGYCVMTMPEVPTILMSNGAVFPGLNGGDKLQEYETLLVNLQQNMENSFADFLRIQESSLPGILILDRASPDTAAYLPTKAWSVLVSSMGVTQEDLLNRYDIVCHLTTAADGAEEHYTNDNNSVRTETKEEALKMDVLTQGCWANHPNRKIFPNSSGGFQEKLDSVLSYVLTEVEKLTI
mmetsp:Transcript_12795/g.12448  ORF Transcript_12795/g.12448 Transcript_12795/m.12448 type:complete len:209 (-) Transcript_12795:254-880(-)